MKEQVPDTRDEFEKRHDPAPHDPNDPTGATIVWMFAALILIVICIALYIWGAS